ncbi:flagellar hook-associated protein FlgK [bacterium]|nr:flagellar hook-associated protein FlgK [bacterium]
MFSEFGAIEIGRQALNAQRRALDVTGHNITNVNTEGYSKQRVVMEPQSPMTLAMTASSPWKGQVGTGVTIATIESLRDNFIDNQIIDENQDLGYYDELSFVLEHIQDIMNEPEDSNLRTALDNFYVSLNDLSQEPEGEAARKLVLENGRYLADTFRRNYDHLSTVADNLDVQIKMEVNEINSIATQIADLNKEIRLFEVTVGDHANDMIDRRSLLIDRLSKKINVQVINHEDSQVSILVNDRLLVSKDSTRRLTYETNDNNRGYNDVRWEDSDPWSSNTDVASVKVYPGAQSMDHWLRVNQIATNQVLESVTPALPAVPPPGGTVTPYLPISGSMGVTSGSITINGETIYIDADKMNLEDVVSAINIQVKDVNAEMVETGGIFSLKLSTPETGVSQHIDLGHISDSSNLLFDAANPLNGFQMITGYDATENGIYGVGVETLASQDAMFQLDGINHTSTINEIEGVLSNVTLFLKGTDPINNTTQLKIKPVVYNGSLMAKMELRDRTLDELISDIDDLAYGFATEFNKVHAEGFGLNGERTTPFFEHRISTELNNASKDWGQYLRVDERIQLDTDAIAASAGEFKPGGLIPELVSVGNNEGAIALIDTKDSVKINGKTISDFFSSMVGDIGVESLNAHTSLERQELVSDQLEKTRMGKMGVSLDEEMTNMMQFQRAFQAAAKFISTIDEMIDILINRLGG